MPETSQTVQEAEVFYNEIVEKYYNLLVWIAYGRAKNNDTAKEAAQEVFLRAWNAIDTLFGYVAEGKPGAVKTWLTTTLRNVMADDYKNYLRTEKAIGMMSTNHIADTAFFEEDNSLDDLFSSFRPTDREILMLMHHENKSLQECAEILGISLSAAKKRSSRAQKRLQKIAAKKKLINKIIQLSLLALFFRLSM